MLAQLREARQMFTDEHARRARGDGAKIAADAGRGVWFQIEGFLLRRPAPEKKLDDVFEARLACGRLSLEELRQAQTG